MSGTKADDLYSLLGVGEDASSEDIRNHYKRLARELHPDRFIGDDSAQAVAQERFAKVSGAYNVLKDATSRSEYDFERKMQRQRGLDECIEVVEAPVEESGYKLEAAERSFKEALQLQAAGDLHRAIEATKVAVELRPNAAPYRALLGALYEKRGWHSYAKAELEQAIKLDPKDRLSQKLYSKILGSTELPPQAHAGNRKRGRRKAKRRSSSAPGGTESGKTNGLKGTRAFRKKNRPFWLAWLDRLWARVRRVPAGD